MSAIYGRKPGGSFDTGWGVAQAGWMRGSNMGTTTWDGWITAFGMRAGKPTSGSANATGDIAIYSVSGTTANALLGEVNGTFTVSAVMADARGGADHTFPPAAPIKRSKHTAYVLAVRSAANTFHFGMDLSGHVMHKRNGVAASFPNPFTADSAVPEGKISVWTVETANTAPKQPSNVWPPENGTSSTTTPVIAADFRDDQEVLPGFSLGQGDTLKTFRVQILNSAKTATVQDSGMVNSDATMRSNRRSTWTAAALAGGTYVCQITHYDQFGVPSPVKEWTFSVVTSSVEPSLASVDVAIASPLRTTSDTPGVTYTWRHQSGTAASQIEFRIRQINTDTVVRSGYTFTLSHPANSTTTHPGTTIFANAGWAALTRGASYRWEVRGQTGSSDWSGWDASPQFIVNKAPNAPTDLIPSAGTAFISPPVLTASFTDDDDDSSALSPNWFVRTGGTGDGTNVLPASDRQYRGGSTWSVATDSGDFPATGAYEYRTVAVDPAGVIGTYSAWTAVTLTTAPAITWTVPASAGATITTGTPTLAWTVDRTQSSFEVTIYRYSYITHLSDALANAISGTPMPTMPVVHRSGTVSSGTGSYAVPAGVLRNETDYLVELWVRTSDGLTTKAVNGFLVQYVARAAVTGLAVAATAGAFETAAADYSEIGLTWTAIGTAGPGPYATDSEFGGYVVQRTDAATGIVETLATLPTRNDIAYRDRTPKRGAAYTYSVAYRYTENLETVTSTPATGAASVTFGHVVISDMTIAGVSVPLRYAEPPRIRHVTDAETIETFDEKPVSFRGVLHYRRVDLDWRIFKDPSGAHSVADVRAALEALLDVSVSTDGLPIPKNLCLRTFAGDLIYGHLIDLEVTPHPFNDRAMGRVVFVEHDVEIGS